MSAKPPDRPRPEYRGEILTITNMIALAGAVLILGVLLDRFAGMEPAYAVGRIVSVPLLVTAIVLAARRRTWPALIVPAAGLAFLASTFFVG
ncbi:hypothetical protein [Myceligenerans pegani]|uniref:Uncharacterized protein n=1 Tax=Myceligenerans pegani TaxID=2776917 RepID=A0ABR9N2K1_9MICO|nr:hypothetical protein [Myceligenerans sp. TRM 65318]MBE1877879.1 hypothetical protein [Myceligenerans sp. TRM 65318]MBE3020150.1 hypothetical protein [Myceligenerans sp. TRM 65318]